MENFKPETQKLLKRMEECSKLPYRFDEPKIRELIKQIWDLTNTPQPKEIVVCRDVFDERLLESASASARAIASASASDYDFDYFCGEVELGNEENKKYIEIMELLLLAKEAGLGYLIDNPNTNILYIAPNPVVRIEDNQFHSDQLPAIEYATWKGYFLDGVNFEKELWEKVLSNKMTFGEIMAIEISDQRTVALKYNPQAILNENSILVHKDDRNNELYRIEGQPLNNDLGFPKIWFLKMLCPTGRVFIEGVPPDEAEKNPNATDLQALLCGLTPSEYYSMKMES